ncbi:MAG: alpha/beta fold hydrolase [Hyphomonadaceae bacterium]|nr:alpha/beta fold hydrolase [Hyphomonadaceae bacterium]
MMMRSAPDWAVEGAHWPNRDSSRFVAVDGAQWHVQAMGEGPRLLLLHGTGAATHSWRDLAPLLARTHRVIAVDLPGHGFTEAPERAAHMALPHVAARVQRVLQEIDEAPEAIIGHSAGAAIAVRCALDGMALPRGVIGLNAALLPFPGAFGAWAPLMARALFYNPAMIALFGLRAAQPGAVARLLASTGSHVSAEAAEQYRALLTTYRHLRATIALMAHWDLVALRDELPRLQTRLTLLAAERDRAIPAAAAHEVAALAPDVRVEVAPGVGHLAHEEQPETVAAAILRALAA